MERVTYRHNIMEVGSLEQFFSIRGGFNNRTKDVYFIRALGECAGYPEQVAAAEGRMAGEMSLGRLCYTRISSLANIVQEEQIRKYKAAYDGWRQSGSIALECIGQNEALNRTVSDALTRTEALYREDGAGRTDSMVKNFGIKLLFWMDGSIGPFFGTWSEKACMKIALENVAKEQEYLFGYFLTLLGCDVLLLENREDVKVSDALKALSKEMTLGNFGTTGLLPYVQAASPAHAGGSAGAGESGQPRVVIPAHAGRSTGAQEHAQPRVVIPAHAGRSAGAGESGQPRVVIPAHAGRSTGAQEHAQPRVVIPAHAGRSTGVQEHAQSQAVVPTHAERGAGKSGQPRVVIPVRAGRERSGQTAEPGHHAAGISQTERERGSVPAGVSAAGRREEKTFEQLAQMASSIVMIADHDRDGEVVGTGSGIMIGQKGYILTNHHVIAAGCSYSVRIEDDEEIYYTDEIIKYNHVLDLAVIRIQRRLSPLAIYDGREKLARGQKVVAIGSPLGLFNSVSDGIISGFRNISQTDMIQFTAPISPGSSGGAVLNMYGEVIGISTAGFDSGQNINLAVGYESIRMFARGFFDE